VRYPRDGSSSRRAETSASSLRALATASPRAEPSIRCGLPPASSKQGEKRGCAGGSGGGPVPTVASEEERATARAVGSEVATAPQRRVAIAKCLRRPPSSLKVGEKRKGSSSPPSSSSSIRSSAPDSSRTRLDLQISIAYPFDLRPYFGMRCVLFTVFQPFH
jgi:hypothetical protein